MDNKWQFVDCSVLEESDSVKVEVGGNGTQAEASGIRVKSENEQCHDEPGDWIKPEYDMYETGDLHVKVELVELEIEPPGLQQTDLEAGTTQTKPVCSNLEWPADDLNLACSSTESGVSHADLDSTKQSVPSTLPFEAPPVGNEGDIPSSSMREHSISSGSHEAPSISNYPSKLNANKPRPYYVCTFCDAKFAQSSNLRTHVRIHTGERPFCCTFCDVKCIKSSDLKKHMHIHSGERPFGCKICDAKFVQSSNLKTHMRIHTGERPFGCTFCGARFVQSINLKRHMKIHTGERPFECSDCDAKFIKSSDLKRHMHTHTGEGPYSCAICSVKFTKPIDLKIHKLQHIGEATL